MPTSVPDPEYVLRGVAGDVFGRSFPLLAPTTVGRDPECDIHLADSGVSRQHARLRPLDYGVELQDLGSTNGSFINGQRVTVGIAGVGDEIAFDQLRFRIGDRHAHVRATPHVPRTAPGQAGPWRAWVAGIGLGALLLAAVYFAGL